MMFLKTSGDIVQGKEPPDQIWEIEVQVLLSPLEHYNVPRMAL